MEYYLLSKLPFPTVLIPYILEYKLRPDWKTCRIHESNLIFEFNRLAREPYVEEIEHGWSLFGVWYILWWVDTGGVEQYGRPPRIRPQDEYYRDGDNYKGWYTQSIMCAFEGI